MMLTKYGIDEWRFMASPFWEISPIGDPTRFYSELEFSRLENLILARASFSAQVFVHDPAAIRGIDHEHLYFERYVSGHGRGLFEDTPTWIDPDVIHMIDLSRRYRSITSEVYAEGTLIPYADVGYDPSCHPGYISLSLNSPRGRVLGHCHEAMLQAQADGSPDEHMWGRAFKGLIRTLLLNEADEEMQENASMIGRALVESFVERRLGDPDLSVDGLCVSLGISRSAIYRLFERDGGILSYIRDLRLDRCFADLMASPPERGRVRRIAERWGFFEPANFNRAFRVRFGVAPSDCRRAQMQSRSKARPFAQHQVHSWMQKN